MNRTLKFRIWDDKLKQFNYFDIFNTHGNITNDCKNNIQQFTGLKDSAGQDIYEGDILTIIEEGGRGEKYKDQCVVKFSNKIACFRAESLNPERIRKYRAWTSYSLEIERYSSIKITGNIFESPDLLLQK